MSDANSATSACRPPRADRDKALPARRLSPDPSSRHGARERRPRLWPALVILAVMWAILVVPGYIPQLQGSPVQLLAMLWGAGGGAIAIGLWWLFASRVPWTDRLVVLLFFSVCSLAARAVSDPSFLYFNYGPIVRGLPLATTALVLWLLVSIRFTWPVRRLVAAIVLILAWGYCDLLRLDGVWGDFQAEVHWRWEPTAEQKLPGRASAAEGHARVVAGHR